MATGDGALALQVDERAASDAADWKRAHAALSRIARKRAEFDAEEGRWLLCALRSAAHVHLGCGSFAEYIERLFGYRPRTTQEKLRVAEALEGLPRLARALETGALGWCAARELTRVAVAETESAWLEAARGKTLHELEALVANRSPGDAPDAPAPERSRPRVLRFEVTPETYATFREAMLGMRRQAGGPLNDDALLLAMARHVLAGPGDGRASYQISLHVCGACGAGAQSAAGELVPVDAAVVDMAQCDAQHLGELLPSAVRPSAIRPQAPARPCESSAHAHVDAESGLPRDAAQAPERTNSHDVQAEAGSSQRGDAGTRSATHERSDRVHGGAAPGAGVSRAKQTIPPALRRAVLARDRHRCSVPGCTHATFVDVHHIRPRSEGGRHEASNLLTLCSAHHRAAHRGELHIERDLDAILRFRHADGTVYGHPVAPRQIEAHAKVYSALRHLGFPEFAVKAVLRELRADAELAAASVQRLLREALRRIKPTAR